MTTGEAIKSLNNELAMVRGLAQARRIDAIKLGIEALKFVNAIRSWSSVDAPDLLPGETEE